MSLPNAIIAGVNKAGTTSLFASLSAHPDVAPSAVKETGYFLPARWGNPLDPIAIYSDYFSDSGNASVRLEATPAYFYGGESVIAAMRNALSDDLKVLIILREPVARFWSFFTFQKARLRIPKEMRAEDYLNTADQMTDEDFANPDNERWFGFRGGSYVDYLPDWHESFGDRLEIVYFEDLMANPEEVLTRVAEFLCIDPAAFPSFALARENQTTGYKRSGLQRIALAFNSRAERFLRRHYRLKDRLRSTYYRINGSAKKEAMSSGVRRDLENRYASPNDGLRTQLVAMARPLPSWLKV